MNPGPHGPEIQAISSTEIKMDPVRLLIAVPGGKPRRSPLPRRATLLLSRLVSVGTATRCCLNDESEIRELLSDGTPRVPRPIGHPPGKNGVKHRYRLSRARSRG